MGWLAARFGRKNLFVTCLAGFTIASMLCGSAESLEQMVVFRFLQGTFSGTRKANDERPDVACGGAGGLSGLRSLATQVNVLMGDSSVRFVKSTVSVPTWRAVGTRNGGETVSADSY